MIRTLLKSVRQYKTSSLLTPVLMVGEAGMEIVIPYLMTFLLKEIEALGAGSGDVWKIVLYSVIMVVCAIFALFCGAIGAKLASKSGAGFAHNLMEDMYANLQTFSFSNIDKYSSASLVTRITTDVSNVRMAYQMCLRMMVRAPILFIFSSIMSFIIEPTAALIFIIAAILLGLLIFFGMSKVAPYFRAMFKKYDDLNSVVQENVTAIRVVKSYVREDYEIEKMKKASKEVYDYSIRAEKILNLLMPTVNLVMYAVIITLIVLGANMSIFGFGNIQYTDIQALITYSTQILSGVMMVAMCLNYISLSRGSMERIAEVLNEKTDIKDVEDPVMEIADGSVSFENVQFSYKNSMDNLVLSDVNLTINSGETVGIIGATGSGKSSLISLIPRLYDVTEGCVKVGGIDVRKYDLDVLRNGVSVVLQKNVLFSGSIMENLRWGNENATDEEVYKAAEMACADEFINGFKDGYDHDLGQGGVNVSGGQKQRLCIARALLKNPKILILDDSTSAVDTKTDANIRAAIKKYAPDTTKIIIAQRISSVEDSDKIIVLDDGKISAVGNHEYLMKNSEIYRDVYESQIKGADEDGKN